VKKQSLTVFLGLLIVAKIATADEGMWPFHNIPTGQIQKKYGVTLSPAWLENLRLSAVRFGASSAFVSADGLILTNHHVAKGCIQRLSTAENDLVKDGFLARAPQDERVCPGSEATILVSYDNVTATLAKSKGDARERQIAIAAIEKQCRDDTKLRCQVVTLYRGGQYWLYRYRVFNDVRLVWAPETRLGFFGGDTDNFVYPRYNLDVALMRAYENGKPVKPTHFLKVAKEGVADGEVVFSAGNPGSTDRTLTAAELNFLRQQAYPIRLANAEDLRSSLVEWGKESAENQRRANDPLFGLENGLKVIRGETKALAVERLHQRKLGDELALKAQAVALAKRGEFKFIHGDDPWGEIAKAAKKQHQYAFEMTGTDIPAGSLMRVAFEIVALPNEMARPAGERLRSYRDSALPQLRTFVTSPRTWHRDLETVRLTAKIDEAMGYLGQEHPFVARMLQGALPKAAAERIIAASTLDNVATRRALIEGGIDAVNQSTDSLVMLMRDLYPIWRSIRERDQREIESVKERAHDDIARLQFHLNGLNNAPDATGTLRFGVGRVAGFDRDGIANAWTTTFHGLYERNFAYSNKAPFDLPSQWLSAKPKLELNTPLNFVSTLDIIGGSSGSPAVNAKGELVGVLFDGNLDGLGNRFQYQERNGRALAVDVRAMMHSLDKVYNATELIRELTPHWNQK
jgi:Peptidase S46